MATKTIVTTISTCDRCGKEFNWKNVTAGYFVYGIRRKNPFRFRVAFDGNPNGMSFQDCRVELCGKCTKKLFEFLCEKGEKENE